MIAPDVNAIGSVLHSRAAAGLRPRHLRHVPGMAGPASASDANGGVAAGGTPSFTPLPAKKAPVYYQARQMYAQTDDIDKVFAGQNNLFAKYIGKFPEPYATIGTLVAKVCGAGFSAIHNYLATAQRAATLYLPVGCANAVLSYMAGNQFDCWIAAALDKLVQMAAGFGADQAAAQVLGVTDTQNRLADLLNRVAQGAGADPIDAAMMSYAMVGGVKLPGYDGVDSSAARDLYAKTIAPPNGYGNIAQAWQTSMQQRGGVRLSAAQLAQQGFKAGATAGSGGLLLLGVGAVALAWWASRPKK